MKLFTRDVNFVADNFFIFFKYYFSIYYFTINLFKNTTNLIFLSIFIYFYVSFLRLIYNTNARWVNAKT